MQRLLNTIFFISLALFSSTACANSAEHQVAKLLASGGMPEGVVFEIVSGDSSALRWVLPRTRQLIDKLRQRYPELPIAIVTHGQEQFALQKKNRDTFKQVHSLTESLVKDSGVNLHVCGTYAEWHGIEAEEFASYANVSPAGPAQINDYVALGYIKVIVDKPDS